MNIKNSISQITTGLGATCRLIAVSKTKPVHLLQEAYDAGQRLFGENKVQEMVEKYEQLPHDIEWHMIGHLQSNKVKYIAPFVSMIHSIDSLKLLEEVNRQGAKAGRVIPCLLQVHIAQEETKFGFDELTLEQLMRDAKIPMLTNCKIIGLMGMATFTDNVDLVRAEFRSLKGLFERIKSWPLPPNVDMKELSMGMSGDYMIAVEEGSTLVRVGSAIFGDRK